MPRQNQSIIRPFDQVGDNPVLLDRPVTVSVCEGLNVALASFQTLHLQYQKHYFVIEGTEFYTLREFFDNSHKTIQAHVSDLAKRLNGLGGVPATSFSKLSELTCFESEPDGLYQCRSMLEHDLQAEQAIIQMIRRMAAQAESMGDRATRHMYEAILMDTEQRAFQLNRFLTADSLILGFVQGI